MLSFIEDCQRQSCPRPGHAPTRCFESRVLWDVEFMQRTSNLQLALHLVLPEIVDGPAGVPAPVKQARLADIQRQHALLVLHQILGVSADDHIVLHPNNLWLESGALNEEANDGGEERGRERINRARDVGRVEEQREGGKRGRGEIRSTFRLDKSLPNRRDEKNVCSKIFLLHLLFCLQT